MSSANEEPTFAPPDVQDDTSSSDNDEYVFRFRLDASADEKGYDDPLLELIRGQIADLLKAVILTYHGHRVMVDGFRLLKDQNTQYEVFPSSGADTREKAHQ